MLETEINSRLLRLNETCLDWPAVAISINGRHIEARHSIAPPKGLSQEFVEGILRFKVSIKPNNGYFIKHVEITSNESLPTPDYVDIDFQRTDDDALASCGYRATYEPPKKDRPEEEGGGIMPGCGYPLIGKKYFTGLEHQAGFNTIEEPGAYRLRHHPIWNGNRLETINAVFGISNDPKSAFRDYLEKIRLKNQTKPLFAFCSFWSDPYLGDYEYQTHLDNYLTYINAFRQLNLHPDIYTLDAGWNDRQTIFHPKSDALGGDAGLRKLREEINTFGSDLSLWLSHNGPMGITPEYLTSLGVSVGSGQSSTYCGEGYGVLMDEKLEKLLTARFCQLAGPEINATHFKMDWDNDCATNPEFNEKYPTRNHVREASINVMNRIAAAIRKVNPKIIIRNGWWPSPWWLCHANHFFLPDSADSEYSTLPAKDQRNSSSTHRDIQYYNVLRRDHSMVPLDCFDNHEFPQAMRNPFTGNPAIWTDTAYLAIMRGSSYLSWKQQPEALEDWQVEAMREIIEFARCYQKNIFVHHGYMTLGHPGKGEIYGFAQPNTDSTWCLLRNPLCIPQTVKLGNIVRHNVASIIQFYPDFREYHSCEEITLLAHEVKVLIFNTQIQRLPFDVPFQVFGNYEYRFPASLNINKEVRPLVGTIYQIPELMCSDQKVEKVNHKTSFYFKLRVPYRMRNFEIQFRLSDPDRKLHIKIYSSRYDQAFHSSYAIPLTEIPHSNPGHGEQKNIAPFCEQPMRYFSAAAASGGETYYRLEIHDDKFDPATLDLWAAGYEAPSRNAVLLNSPPTGFNKKLPYPHPFGFPVCIKCDFKENLILKS